MNPQLKRTLYWIGSACSLLVALILPVASPLRTAWIVYPITGFFVILCWFLAFLALYSRATLPQ